jgi:hypothetical protein
VVGDYVLEYSVTDGSGNGPVTITRTVKVVDTEAPVIFSFVYDDGDNVEVPVNTKFTAPKFIITDNYYTGLTGTDKGTYFATFADGIATALGNYTYVLEVTDGSGNMSEFTLYIKVVDNEAPVITLEGNPYVEICRFETLNESATATDNFDQNVTVVEGGSYVTDYLVNMAAGLYSVTYDATDAANNSALQVIRTVKVIEQGEGPCGISDLSENTLAKSVTVYPNPSNGRINVGVNLSQSADMSIVISNALGQVVYESVEYNVSSQIISLDLDLSNGLYHISLKTEGGNAFFPIVIAK